jgi:hypothetical protein
VDLLSCQDDGDFAPVSGTHQLQLTDLPAQHVLVEEKDRAQRLGRGADSPRRREMRQEN